MSFSPSDLGDRNVHSLDRAQGADLIVMSAAATSATFPGKRFVHNFTRRFRGNAHPPAESAGSSCHAAGSASPTSAFLRASLLPQAGRAVGVRSRACGSTWFDQ
jgi:hypothetical protein